MQVGDLVRLAWEGANCRGLRIVRRVDGNITYVTTPDGGKKNALGSKYRSTYLTVDDCKWLEKENLKVKLRTLDPSEMNRLCDIASQRKAHKLQWETLVNTLGGKSFVPKLSGGYPDSGSIGGATDIPCTYVIPTCCLTLAPSDLELTAHELLHGKKEEIKITYKIVMESELHPPKGWDNVQRGFCCGDWLINKSASVWGIFHPVVEIKTQFDNPQSAANFIEEYFQCK